jgi:hypothetical protein
MTMLGICCPANISVGSIEEIEREINQIAGGGLSMGGRRGLMDLVGILRDEHHVKVKEHLDMAHGCFSLTVDGSPFFADAVAFKIRFVLKKTNEIMELLLHVKLCKKTLNGESLAHELLKALQEIHKIDIRNWRAFQMDRASANEKGVRLVCGQTRAKPLAVACASHGLNNAGKQFDFPCGKEVLKHLTRMAKFGLCEARDVFCTMFSENALKGGGCRWCIYFEHASQTDQIGLSDIIEHVDVCVDQKFSIESAKGLQALLEDPDFLARAMVEPAAVADGGKPLCQARCKMEGDNPLVLAGHGVLSDLACIIEDDVFEWPNLEIAADNACNVMAWRRPRMQ